METAPWGPALRRYLPFLAWLPHYQRGWARADLVAGLTVWAVLVPESVAYAQLAGVPPVAALSAAPGALLAYALVGSSRQAIVGGTSALAIMSAATVASLTAASGARYMSLTADLAVLTGTLALLFGVARLGFVASFLSRPVMSGFIFGLSLVVAVGQVPKLCGLPGTSGTFFQKGWGVATHLSQTNGWTLLIAVVSLTLLFGLKRVVPAAPAALVAVLVGTLSVAVFGLRRVGVSVVGTIPAGLPHVGWPTLSGPEIVLLLPGALGIVLVGYAEHLGAIRVGPGKQRDEVDANQELIALGVANIGAGLLRGFVVGGSLSKTTVNEEAGARTELSGLVVAGLVVVTGLVLTPLFYDLPEATLGAIVIAAVWKLLDVGELRRFYRLSREGFILAVVALSGELATSVLGGLLIAVALSFVVLIYRASRPHVAILGRFPGELTYADLTLHPQNETFAGLVIVRLDAQLFFANDALLRDRLLAMAHGPEPVRVLLLDLEATTLLDISSADTLAEIATELTADGIQFQLARVRDPVRAMLQRSGVATLIGEEHIYHTVDEGVRAYLATELESIEQ